MAISGGANVNTSLDGHDAVRAINHNQSALHDILRRIEGEYREMPGMCVTASQAQRLWGIDSTTCNFVLETLVERRVLRRTARGTYVKS
jgi:hypothetical protein